MKEIWKDIIEYEGYYQISNSGRVKSLERYVKLRGEYFKKIKEKIRKQTINNKPYIQINLFKNSVQINYLVSRLVAIHFIPNPDNKPYVNHKDGNKHNNIYTNLEWVNASENQLHAIELGLINSRKPVLMLSLDNKPLLWFNSMKEASEAAAVDPSSISKCCRKIRKTIGGYKWKYYNVGVH